MISEQGIKAYQEYVNAPWGKLFYRILHSQLDLETKSNNNLKVLDFGSGFGITANYLSTNNDVTGVEPDTKMINNSLKTFNIVKGGFEVLAQLENETYDLVICHNVLEYIDNSKIVLEQFRRLLKKNGRLSIVKHNLAGKINSLAVYCESPGAALSVMKGNHQVESDKFGQIKYYEINSKTFNHYRVIKEYGIRVFYGNVYRNEIKYEEKWNEEMFELEMAVCENMVYSNIAFWKHIILEKIP